MKWYIDFSGYCMIEAETAEEAETKFWKGLRPPCEEAFDDVWDIDGIEERPEEDPLEPVYGDTFKTPSAQEIEDFWHDR